MKKKMYRFALFKNNGKGCKHAPNWETLYSDLNSKYECDKNTELLNSNAGSRFVVRIWANKIELRRLLFYFYRTEKAYNGFKWSCNEVKNTKMHVRYFNAWF